MKLPLIGVALLLSACAVSRTTIQSSWTDAEYSGPPLNRVAVVALFDTRADSLAFERSAADYLADRGVATVAAHELLPAADIPARDETQIREQLAATNVDGILIFRLVAIDERRDYQVPTPYRTTLPSAVLEADAYSWYHHAPSTFDDSTRSSGYWIEQDLLVAETALFENRSARLLWTAKSETLDGARLQHTSESIVRSVARQLFAMDLIARMTAQSDCAQPPGEADGSLEPASWTGRNRA
jgi:hypothetical protein